MTAAKAAAIIFTSGSSGPPKAAVLSLGNLLHNAWQSNSNIALTPGDTWLLSLPLHHVAGLGILFRCITAGAAIGLLSPADSLEDGARHTEATHFSLVARQLARLLDTEGGRAVLGRARAVLLGGSAIPGGLIAEGCRAHLPLFTSYGMTEMASQVTTTSPGASEEELGTSGRPLAPGVIRIGEDGLVQVNGPTRFLGYWQDGALHGPFDGNGWYRTGDRGHVDEKGNLHITGRADNMFVAGGENIQPEVIERALYEISGVRQAVVVPVPHPEFGAMPVAFVEDEQMRDGVEILEILRGQVPSFQVPRHLFPWPDEDTAGMKISRAAFAKKAATLLETG